MRTTYLGMPKKTKKEKILAQLHRSHFSPVVTYKEPTPIPDSEPIKPSSFTLPQHRTPSVTQVLHTTEYSLMKRDLLKTVTLASLILIGEFILSLWLVK